MSERQKDRPTDSLTDRQTDRQTERQIEDKTTFQLIYQNSCSECQQARFWGRHWGPDLVWFAFNFAGQAAVILK